MKKVQSMSVNEFMSGKEWSYKKFDYKQKTTGLAGCLVGMTSILTTGIYTHFQTASTSAMAVPAMAYQPVIGGVLAGASVAKITTAFLPLIQLLQDLAFPITSIIITGACFLYMINMKDKATSLMINGIIGFFLIHLCPIFMRVLAEIAKSM